MAETNHEKPVPQDPPASDGGFDLGHADGRRAPSARLPGRPATDGRARVETTEGMRAVPAVEDFPRILLALDLTHLVSGLDWGQGAGGRQHLRRAPVSGVGVGAGHHMTFRVNFCKYVLYVV